MLSVVACVEDITFDVEIALSQQLGTQTLPFPGMDSEYILYNTATSLLALLKTLFLQARVFR